MKAYGYFTQGELMWTAGAETRQALDRKVQAAMKEYPDLMFFIGGSSRNNQVALKDGKVVFLKDFERMFKLRQMRVDDHFNVVPVYLDAVP